MGDNDTQIVLLISSLLRNFVFTFLFSVLNFFTTVSRDLRDLRAPDFQNKTSFISDYQYGYFSKVQISYKGS